LTVMVCFTAGALSIAAFVARQFMRASAFSGEHDTTHHRDGY